MTTSAPPLTPFKGLSPFADTDADAFLFFGRTRETETIAANLQAARITILFGPTGVGKTSILRAGVAHRLRREPNTRIEIVDTWSGDFETAVHAALSARGDEDVYVILDQFEEYFNYSRNDEPFASALADAVLDPGSRVNVLIGIRDDALARLDVFRRRIPTLLANRLRLERLDRRAAAEAINGPIDVFNRTRPADEAMSIEPALVDALLDEVAVGRVQLGTGGRGAATNGATSDRIEAPFLQLVLERLWDAELAQGSRLLRLSTLQELGGAATIVRDHLERAMAGLTADEQRAAAAMYRHLVTPSGTKIAHDVSDLAGYADVEPRAAAVVLGKLARERIVRGSSDDGPSTARYEIYHDVLADAVLGWRARYEQERELERAHGARRRARIVATAALVGLIVVAGIALFALLERSHAQKQTRHAHARELVAKARTALDVDPRTSIVLALHAAKLERSTEVEDVLRDALITSRVRRILAAPHAVVAQSSDGFYVGDSSGRFRFVRNSGSVSGFQREWKRGIPVTAIAVSQEAPVVGARDGTVAYVGHGTKHIDGAVTALAISRRMLAAGSSSGNVSGWTSLVARPWRVHVRGRVSSLAYSPDGRLLLVTSNDRRARLVNAQTGRVVQTLTQRGYIHAAAFSPNGRVVVTGSQDKTARIWDVRSGRIVHELEPATGGFTAISFSPDGKLVALANADGVSRVYDVATGAIRFYLSGDINAISDIGFHPGGAALVTGSADRTARIWTADVGRLLFVLRGHRDGITRAFFTSDGAHVVTVGADDTVRVWDPGTAPDLAVVVQQATPFVRGERRGDGTIAIDDATGRTRILDRSGRRVVRQIRGGTPTGSAPQAHHGALTARAATNEVVTVSDGGHVIHRFHAYADSLEFSPDGRLLASGGHDHYLRVWDVDSGRLRYAVVAHQGPVKGVSFTPDGRWLATAGPISAAIWSVATGRELLLLHGPTKPLRAVVFAGNNRTLVTAGLDGTIRRYDCVVCGTLPQLVRAAKATLDATRPR